jgi:ADP-heptose:LPS heptosyltransferase
MQMSSQTNQIDARWVRYRAVSYLRGKGISLGAGPDPILPKQALDPGKYSLCIDLAKGQGVDICDDSFGIIAPKSCDHVFVGPRTPQEFLAEAVGKLKEGGHLIIHSLRPEAWPVELHGLWQAKDSYSRGGSYLWIYKLLGHSQRGLRPAKQRSSRRACIARYGAIGDIIILSPLIKRLALDGYEVTLNVTPYCSEVLKHNPYVSNVVIQERDSIPNGDLGPYWKEWQDDYDKYINLSESIEGKLLRVEGRRDFYTSKAWRQSVTGEVNYFDQTMRLGGYPEAVGQCGELYLSRSEQREAEHVRDLYKNKFLVLWGLKGSSHHKQYPALRAVLEPWLARHRDAWVVLCGSEHDRALQFEGPQIICGAGEMPLRQSLGLTAVADLVVGPESALLNAAGCYSTPKIALLSHSTPANLTKYWTNCTNLQPEVACAGCQQLHYNLNSCPTELYQGKEYPVCTTQGVSPERLTAALDQAYQAWQSAILEANGSLRPVVSPAMH